MPTSMAVDFFHRMLFGRDSLLGRRGLLTLVNPDQIPLSIDYTWLNADGELTSGTVGLRDLQDIQKELDLPG